MLNRRQALMVGGGAVLGALIPSTVLGLVPTEGPLLNKRVLSILQEEAVILVESFINHAKFNGLNLSEYMPIILIDETMYNEITLPWKEGRLGWIVGLSKSRHFSSRNRLSFINKGETYCSLDIQIEYLYPNEKIRPYKEYAPVLVEFTTILLSAYNRKVKEL